MAAPAQTVTTLVTFTGTNGSAPDSLMQGVDGNIYGATSAGGSDTYTCLGGCGTLFKLTTAGDLTTILNFDGKDGISPAGSMIQTSGGVFYGTTMTGGIHKNCSGGVGCGTIFAVSSGGLLTKLHNFAGTDGAYPSGLVRGLDGSFYGTTYSGGTYGNGTFFKITPSGVFTTLESFGTPAVVFLVLGPDGNFYGATPRCTGTDNGEIYKITPAGTQTLLFSFDLTNGACPDALIVGGDGSLYGTTNGGGTNVNDGTVFKLTLAGKLTTLHNFDGTDGTSPTALIQGSDGNFYGTTVLGGADTSGTFFQITPGDTFTSLASFDYSDVYPGVLMQDTSGVFYGITESTLYSLSTGLGPFVQAQPDVAKAGQTVDIIGTDLTGSTSVTFNGTPAHFKVVSPTLITTIVPAGATTGVIQVVTPGGTLSNKNPFRVLP